VLLAVPQRIDPDTDEAQVPPAPTWIIVAETLVAETSVLLTTFAPMEPALRAVMVAAGKYPDVPLT
jgi:hypothetical protein